MSFKANGLLSAVGVAVLAACAPASEGQMRSQASREFECPSSQITVEHISATTIEVRGCGKSALYVCDEGTTRPATDNHNSALVTEDEARHQLAGASCRRIKR